MGSPQYSFPFLIPFSVNSPWWAAFSNKEARSDKQIMPFSASNPEWTGDTKKVATPLPQPKKPPRQSRQLFGDFCTVASDGGGGTDDATSDGGGGGTDGGGQEGDRAQVADWARLAAGWPFKKARETSTLEASNGCSFRGDQDLSRISIEFGVKFAYSEEVFKSPPHLGLKYVLY